jgi:hypothetical protein
MCTSLRRQFSKQCMPRIVKVSVYHLCMWLLVLLVVVVLLLLLLLQVQGG